MTPETLKSGRLALGLTQNALGKTLGISMRQIRRYESAQSEIPEPVAILLNILTTGKIPRAFKQPVRKLR